MQDVRTNKLYQVCEIDIKKAKDEENIIKAQLQQKFRHKHSKCGIVMDLGKATKNSSKYYSNSGWCSQ